MSDIFPLRGGGGGGGGGREWKTTAAAVRCWGADEGKKRGKADSCSEAVG